MNKFPIIAADGDIQQFIKCWSSFYDYSGNEIYFHNINSKPITKTNIRELFKWKNNMRLSDLKDISLETKIISKLKTIRVLQRNNKVSFKLIQENFKDVSAIWLIFLAHIINPNKFPIFDQHVYRAMIYLQSNKIEELKNNNLTKLQKYEFEYLPFFNEIPLKKTEYKKFDEAMWAFGKFLSQNRLNKL